MAGDRIATEAYVNARQSYLFSRDIDAAVAQGEHRWKAERDLTITNVIVTAGDAPIGDDLIFDLMLDAYEIVPGGSLYTTTASRPTVPDGANDGVGLAPDLPSVLEGHYITVDTIQVGNPTPGSKIDLRIFYE